MERNGAVIKASELESIMVAADKLGVTRQRIHQMFNEGKLDYYRIGKRRLVHKRDIERLVRAKAKPRKVA
jgi:excisionase family DNA binding protein